MGRRVPIILCLVVAVFILHLPTAQAENGPTTEIIGKYSINVLENGDALVELEIDGSGTVNIPLPLDVVSTEVEGALYLQAPNGIDVSIGPKRSAKITYQTSLLTTKPSDAFEFEMQLPDFGAATLSITLPSNVEITKTSPTATISLEGDFINSYWVLVAPENETIYIRYRFKQFVPVTEPEPNASVVDIPAAEKIEEPLPREGMDPSQIGGLLLVIGASALYYYNTKGRQRMRPSYASQSVMNTLTENELKIVNVLLEKGGEMKRNKLEKASKIAKSSLASALYRMEERNILEVDKTGAVHYVRLTEWFRSL